MWPDLGDCVVTVDLKTPRRTIHVLFGAAVAPDDGNFAINHRDLDRVLHAQPSPAEFLAVIDQDLAGVDFE